MYMQYLWWLFLIFQLDLDFDVEGGEHFGFFWTNYGIVAYNWTERDENDDSYNQNYCGGNDKPEVEGSVDLDLSSADNKDSWSHRDYAIWFHVTTCGKKCNLQKRMCYKTLRVRPSALPFGYWSSSTAYHDNDWGVGTLKCISIPCPVMSHMFCHNL